MGPGQHPGPRFGLQGEGPNDMPYGREGAAFHQQSGRPLNERDQAYARGYHHQEQPAEGFMSFQSPEPPYIHSSGPIKMEKLDAEKWSLEPTEMPPAYSYENENKHRLEMEKLQQDYNDKIKELGHDHKCQITEMEQNHRSLVERLNKVNRKLKCQNWLLEVELFGKMEPHNSDEYAETYRKLTEEFTLLEFDADQPGEPDRQKPSDRTPMPYSQKKLLSLHNSYVQTQISCQNYDLAYKVRAIPEMINIWRDINAAEYRHAYSLWCTVLCKKGDKSVEDWLREIWPKVATEGDSTDVRLWRFQIGDQLCDFFDDSDAGLALRGMILEHRVKAQKELHDVTVRARLHEDTIQTRLLLAEIHLNRLRAIQPDNISILDERRIHCRNSAAILTEIWKDERRLGPTSTILTAGQKLGCLLYNECREEKAEEAQKVLEAVWEARKARLPRDLEDALVTGHYLFLTYAHLQKHSEAKSIFEEVWQTVEFLRKSKLDESLNFYCLLTDFLRQNLTTRAGYGAATELVANPDDDDRLKLCVEIGMVFLRDKRYPEAESILRQAYDAYIKASGLRGLQHEDAALACGRCLAQAVAEQNKYSEAVQIFREVLPERAIEGSGAQQVDELEFLRYYGDVLMKYANYEISSNSRPPRIGHLYFQAIKVFPEIVQEVFKKPEMHKCARHLLLELVQFGDVLAAELLLDKILNYSEVDFREILPYSFRYELCKSVMEQRNYEMAIGLFRKIMDCPGWEQGQLRAQEVSGDLGFYLLEKNRPGEALIVFENAKEILSNACHEMEEGRQNALANVQRTPIPTVILTENESATENATPKPKEAEKAKETPEANTGARLKRPATAEVRPRSEERSTTRARGRPKYASSLVEAVISRPTTPVGSTHRKMGKIDNSPQRKRDGREVKYVREPRRAKSRGRLFGLLP